MLNKDHQSASSRTQALLNLALATEHRTWQAFTWEVAAREAKQRDDPHTALKRINAAFRISDGFDTPLADWRLHRTAAAICALTKSAQKFSRSISKTSAPRP